MSDINTSSFESGPAKSPNRSPFQAKASRVRAHKVRVKLPHTFHWRLASRVLSDCEWLLPNHALGPLRAALGSFPKWERACDVLSLRKLGDNSRGLSNLDVAGSRLVACIVKKCVISSDAASQEAAAVSDMLHAERICSDFNRSGYKRLMNSEYYPYMMEFCSKTIGCTLPHVEQLCLSARHGPGAVFGQVGAKSGSKYDKYKGWPYSVTPRARKHAVEFIRSDPRWMGALESDYRARHDIKAWSILNFEAFWDKTLINVTGNRITTVPKDWSKDRPIAIEPTLNMMLQLGVDGFIRRRLKRRWGIDLNDQKRNQELARAGSINPNPDSPATIDLSMASDTVSLRLAKMLLPPEWYEYLLDLRSPSGEIPDGRVIRYSKLSSMGNGTTFAIESLIFSAACYAVIKVARWSWKEADPAVFGDDIALPRVLAPDLNFLLRLCGFSPNLAKSFAGLEPVRESCGTDWFRAYPVRGVYIKKIPVDIMELFHTHNALWIWSQYHSSPLDSTLKYLKSAIVAAGFGAFTGPPNTQCTDQYLFDPSATMIRGVAKRMSRKKPKDFLWGKLLASYSPHSDSHQWDPLRDVIGSGSVFTRANRRDWHYVTYTQTPSGVRDEINDAAKEFTSTLSR